jgi:regulator of replication initiation timing
VSTEAEALRKELAQVNVANQHLKAENQNLQLRLKNALMALKLEMTTSGSLVKIGKPGKIVGRH